MRPPSLFLSAHPYLFQTWPRYPCDVRQRSLQTTVSALPTAARLKRPTRGQNLSERYRRLERMLRGKEAYAEASNVNEGTPTRLESVGVTQRETFMGFVVPEKPREPAADECCMSGCAICVYDLYEDALESYKASLETLRHALDELNVPEFKRPLRVQRTRSETTQSGPRSRDVITNAFEAFERSLQAKRQAQDHSSLGAVVDVRERGKGELQGGVAELYEGLKWVLFSKR